MLFPAQQSHKDVSISHVFIILHSLRYLQFEDDEDTGDGNFADNHLPTKRMTQLLPIPLGSHSRRSALGTVTGKDRPFKC